MTLVPCPIWGPQYQANVDRTRQGIFVDNSGRAAGSYVLARDGADYDVGDLALDEKAKLTTWLIDQRLQGKAWPTVDTRAIDYAKKARPLSVTVRATRLLRYIAKVTSTVGTRFDLRRNPPEIYAWSESIEDVEVTFLIQYLIQRRWLASVPESTDIPFGNDFIPDLVRITVEGHTQIEEQATNPQSSQGFVAMWFDESVDDVFVDGLSPAINEAGYAPLKINQKPTLGKIDDETVAEIRRSRFVVADFTHGRDGARGSVYFEAGFAEGLSVPVIYTCRSDQIDTLHFDVQRYPFIAWDTPEQLRSELYERIVAVLGEGIDVASAST